VGSALRAHWSGPGSASATRGSHASQERDSKNAYPAFLPTSSATVGSLASASVQALSVRFHRCRILRCGCPQSRSQLRMPTAASASALRRSCSRSRQPSVQKLQLTHPTRGRIAPATDLSDRRRRRATSNLPCTPWYTPWRLYPWAMPHHLRNYVTVRSGNPRTRERKAKRMEVC
jgi:hypothetical protein